MAFTYPKNGETLALDASACTGCGACVDVCPHAVFGMERVPDGGPESLRASILRRDRCMECGACALNCPSGALKVSRGVGCVAAIIAGKLTGKAPSCGGGSGACCDSPKPGGTCC